MEIEQTVWGFTEQGEAIIIYTMTNSSGASVRITNLGAALVSLTVPDLRGELADVVLGYPRWEDYAGDGAAMGKIVGRVANRTANSAFSLDGIRYTLNRNTPPHHLHGGVAGFAERVWQSRVETNRVVFSLLSEDGDQGYPGELSVEAVYDWDDDNELEITMFAKSDRATAVNLTSHLYLNLSGESSGSVLGHELQLESDFYLPIDRGQIPTGEQSPVEGTPMDFRSRKTLARDFDADFEQLRLGYGYDHCWAIRGWEKGVIRKAAELYDPASGRDVKIYTSQPGIQVYTGNFLQGGSAGKSGRAYADHDGVALECQGFPNALNEPSFPSQRLDPDDVYEEHILFRFGVRS